MINIGSLRGILFYEWVLRSGKILILIYRFSLFKLLSIINFVENLIFLYFTNLL